MAAMYAASALIFGGFISLLNWCTIYASRRSNRFVSPVPLLGGVCLVFGLLGFPQTRPYAFLGIFGDYGTITLFCAIPVFAKEMWSTSSINLLHRFVGVGNGRRDDIRLFKGSNFTIRCRHEPPAPCNGSGALVESYGLVGTWREHGDGLRLSGYDGERVLDIRKKGDKYVTKEMNYPADRTYRYDRLDALDLSKVR